MGTPRWRAMGAMACTSEDNSGPRMSVAPSFSAALAAVRAPSALPNVSLVTSWMPWLPASSSAASAAFFKALPITAVCPGADSGSSSATLTGPLLAGGCPGCGCCWAWVPASDLSSLNRLPMLTPPVEQACSITARQTIARLRHTSATRLRGIFLTSMMPPSLRDAECTSSASREFPCASFNCIRTVFQTLRKVKCND